MRRANAMFRITMVLGLAAGLAACDDLTPRDQRTLSGGAIGAGAGAIVGAAAFGNPAAGAAVGGATGAVIGNQTR